MTCDRCYQPAQISTMSRFNTDTICVPCEKLEKAHPKYKEAQEAELAACERGNFNFPGIGLPIELHRLPRH